MAQKNRKADEGSQAGITAEHYYDYEARFVKQKREQERIKPPLARLLLVRSGRFPLAAGNARIHAWLACK